MCLKSSPPTKKSHLPRKLSQATLDSQSYFSILTQKFIVDKYRDWGSGNQRKQSQYLLNLKKSYRKYYLIREKQHFEWNFKQLTLVFQHQNGAASDY